MRLDRGAVMTHDYLSTRNVQVRGGRTTIALEPEFWGMLEEVAKDLRMTPSGLIQEIDAMRGRHPRASAIRVYVLMYHWSAASGSGFRQQRGWEFSPGSELSEVSSAPTPFYNTRPTGG